IMKPVVKFVLTIILMTAGMTRVVSQTAIPEILETGTLREQMNYLDEKTRIYENYRAIREDMFQLVRRNAVDSLAKAQRQIMMLAGMNRNLIARIDSLTVGVVDLESRLDEAVRTKESIRILGMNINKTVYNSIMWIIVAALLFLLGLGFLTFKSNLSAMLRTKKELDELKVEFEAYRQKKRIEIEKMGMDHFNELKKLRGG